MTTYATRAEADAYYAARGNDAWATLTDPQKDSALVLATDYIEATYLQAWQGNRVSSIQELSWPRYGVYVDGFQVDSTTVPAAVVKATIEMAGRAAAGEPLITDQAQRVTKEKVDVLEVTYSEASSPELRYPYVNRLLSPYLKSSVGGDGLQTVRLVRT